MITSSPPLRATHRRPAAGMSLIELCAVMAANAILIAVILSALYSLGRADRSYSTRIEKLRGVSELSTRLREDLHAAESLDWDEPARKLRLAQPTGDTVVYAREDDRWERRFIAAGDSEAGELTAAFRVPTQLNATFAPAEAAVGEQIHVVWQAERDADRDRPALPTPPELSVTLGRDQKVLHE